jgi:hypothetical protein
VDGLTRRLIGAVVAKAAAAAVATDLQNTLTAERATAVRGAAAMQVQVIWSASCLKRGLSARLIRLG